jgi:hypothetical protein
MVNINRKQYAQFKSFLQTQPEHIRLNGNDYVPLEERERLVKEVWDRFLKEKGLSPEGLVK